MTHSIAIIGGGPAGLIAAEQLVHDGFDVTVYERMPTLGRKFLMAGRGGLNLTHSEPLEAFLTRYREAADWLAPMLEDCSPDALREWADDLDQETFVGSSGRVFPKAMKASPLLRAWRARLDELGVAFRLRHYWTGWTESGALSFDTPDGSIEVEADGVLLALGGASWPRLGSDAGWVDELGKAGVEITPFRASNCGVEIAWSDILRERFAGQPLKAVAMSVGEESVRGEAMIASYGLEGGAVYALSAPIREALDRDGQAELVVDLRPTETAERLADRLSKARKGESLSTMLKKRLKLAPQASALLREAGPDLPRDPMELAQRIKAVPLTITAQRGLDRAISSSGGIRRDAVDDSLMLTARPGVFVAGEMLDWDAPTGGYLLQASFATGVCAAEGLSAWLSEADH